MSYTVTRPLKNKGLAAFLAVVPFGLFYSTIWGGIVMYFVVPILVVLSIFTGLIPLVLLFFITPIYLLVCLLWSISAVSDYNRNIIKESDDLVSSRSVKQTDTTIDDELMDKKLGIYQNLETLKKLYDSNILDEKDYTKQKESLLRHLDILTHNESSKQVAAPEFYENKQVKKSNLTIVFLIFLIVLSFLFLAYQKRLFENEVFDAHAKDKSEIKKQIEKAYFGIINGAYTSQTMQGIGPEGLPFYNQDLSNAAAMGLLPFANMFDAKITLEPKNIEVYSFSTENAAYVKYDLVLTTSDTRDSLNIDMEVKKIGGYWKLDGSKVFGFKNSSKEAKKYIGKKNRQIELSSDNKNDNYILKEYLENPNIKAFKVNRYSDVPEGEYKNEITKRYFIFCSQKIFMVADGEIERILHITAQHTVNENEVSETKEGYTLTEFGDITVTTPSKVSTTYDIEEVPINEVYIDSRYIK